MCTPKIISSFAPKIRIVIIKTSVTFLLVNLYSTKHRNNLNIQIKIVWCT